MTEKDRRDPGERKEPSAGAGREEREQMLDRASMESALKGLSPSSTGAPSSPAPQPAQPSEPDLADPSREAPVRLRMEDIERLAVKPRASSIPPAGEGEGDAAPQEKPRDSRPPDAASMGNTMKALFDSRVSAEAESDADLEAMPATDGRIPGAAGREAVAAEPAGGHRAPGPSVSGARAEAGPVAGPGGRPPASEKETGGPSDGSAEARPAAGRKAIWIGGVLAVSAAAALWIAVAGQPAGTSPDREPRTATGSVSPARSLPGSKAGQGEGPGSTQDETAVEDGSEGGHEAMHRSRRNRRAVAHRSHRDERARGLEERRDPAGGESAAEERTAVSPEKGTDAPPSPEPAEPAQAAEPTSPGSGAAATVPAGSAPAPAREPVGVAAVEAETSPNGEPLSQVPDRDSVKTAMEKILEQVRACAGDKHGVAEVVLTVKHTGRVSYAEVKGDFAGTPEGSCIARTVRKAHLQPFLRPSFTLVYPFAL